MGENLHLKDSFFHVYEEPKKYSSIKETFITNWQDNHNFLPNNYLKSFDSLLFYNFIHRECFRSSITRNSSNIETSEVNFYKNCVSKHQYSIQVFSNILKSSRKWKGFLAYVDLKEYSRAPEEMGTNIPTNPIIRKQYLDMVKIKENEERKKGIENVLGNPQPQKPMNFVYEYILKKRGFSSKLDLEEAFASKNLLAEYNRLNEAYGADFANEIKTKVDLKNWGGIPGDDFTAEDEDSGSPAAAEVEGADAPSGDASSADASSADAPSADASSADAPSTDSLSADAASGDSE